MSLFSRRRKLNRRPLNKSFRPRIEQLESRRMLSAADLTAWSGVENNDSPNDYAVVSAVSVGGTLDARRYGGGQSAAYLGDTSLSVTGGELTASTSGGFGATGSLTFDASTDDISVADPVFYLGFFDKDNLSNGAFGFSIANQTTTSFRFRASAGTTQTSGSGTVVDEGTYTFELDVNNSDSGDDKVRFRLFDGATTELDVSVNIPGSGTPTADSFGFLQPAAGSGSDVTFEMTLDEINYTGDTEVVVAAPTNLTATAGEGQVSLSWQDNATTESLYKVESKVGAGGTWTELTTLAANSTSYVDTELTDGTTYYYRVRAEVGSEVSNWSSEESATPAPAGIADLSGWSGVENQDSPNDYSVISAVSAGGTFDSRRYGAGQDAGYLADTSLSVTGGELTASTSGGFSSSGTLTFNASTDDVSVADPVFRFGFFDKDDLTNGAFGFSIANQTTTSFRFRASAGTTETSGSGTVVSEGTYTYDLDVNNVDSGANKVRFRLFDGATTALDVSVDIPGSGTPTADSFGFLQPVVTNNGSDVTFGMTLDEINYTGDTEVTVPTAPSELTATAAEGQVTLAWQDNATNETGFIIERKIGSGGTWEELAILPANATSYVNTGLSDGTTYYYRVRAQVGSVVSDWSSEASVMTPTAPAAPSGLSATGGQGQVTLTWTDNSSNETSFSIERKIGTGGTWEVVATVAADETAYIDTGLNASTTYYYQIQALNGGLASAYSSEASATTDSASGFADVTNWSGVENEDSPNAYTVISDVSVGGEFDSRRYETGQNAAYLADTSLSVTGGELTASTSGGFGATGTLTFDASTDNSSVADPVFYFGFFDKDDLTNGAFGFSIANQTTSSFRFRASAGTTQTSGSGTVVDEGTYTFELDVNNSDSGTDKVRFRLVDPMTSSTELDVSVDIPGSGTPTADSFGFLQPMAGSGSDVTFVMTLNDINYDGETLVSAPSAPSGLTATAATGQVSLSWQNNATNATGHTIERKIGSGGTWTELATVAVDVTDYVDSGLADDTTYYYRIRSFNSAGASAWSSEASATTPDAPNAPSNLTATAATRQVSIAWQDNSTNETGFVIERKIGAGSFSQLTTVGVNVTSYVDTGLSDNTLYTYRVLARNDTGDSAWSNEASDTTPQASVPAPPSDLSATATAGQVSLAWTDNSDNETGFVVQRRIGATATWTEITTTAANATTYDNTGLDDGTTYYYRVQAENASGSSDFTSEASATTPFPAGIADLSGFSGSGNTSGVNNYAASTASAGGTFDARRAGAGESAAYLADTSLSVTGGELTASTSGGFAATGTLTFDASTDNTSLADPVFYFGFFDKDDLTKGAFGFSIANSSTSAFRFRASAGTAQTTGSGIVIGEGTYTFDLDVNNTQSGDDLVRFRLLSGATTVLDVSVAIPASGTPSADSFGFLQPAANGDSDVTFGLSVSNINYTGETLVTGTPTAPAAPSNLAATAGNEQVSLTWIDNSNDETGFTIERKVGQGSYSQLVVLGANVTSYIDTGLTGGTTYTYKVKAQNGAGSSAFSNEVSSVPSGATNPPAAPTQLADTDVSTSEVSLSWTDNSSDETGFSVERRLGTSGTWTVLTGTPLAANTTTYDDSTVAADTTYQYRVRAHNGSLNSGYSNVLTVATPPEQSISIYYITPTGSDTNNGTSTNSGWATLDHALQNAPNDSIVYLTAGTYGYQETLTDPERTGMVTFKPFVDSNGNEDEVVMKSDGAPTTNPPGQSGFSPALLQMAINWRHVDHVRLEGLKFEDARVYVASSTDEDFTENFEFVRNEMVNSELMVFGVDGGLVEGNSFHGYKNDGRNAIFFRSYDPILFDGGVGESHRDFSVNDLVIRENTIDMNNEGADGIHVEWGENVTIEKNVIKNIKQYIEPPPGEKDPPHGDSMQLLEVKNSTIHANHMLNARGIIIQEYHSGVSDIANSNNNLTITNNVHFYRPQGAADFSLKLIDAPNATVVNNTFWSVGVTQNGNEFLSKGYGLNISNKSTNVTVLNNIVSGFTLSAGGSINTSASGNNLVKQYFDNASTLSGDIQGEASFVNKVSGDLRLQAGSLGIDAGISNALVPSQDKDGNDRVGAPDMGAYEFQP